MFRRILPYLAAGLLCILFIPSMHRRPERSGPLRGEDSLLTCILRLDSRKQERQSRILVSRYAEDHLVPVSFLRVKEGVADSVLLGKADIVVSSSKDTSAYKGLVSSIPAPGGTLWSSSPDKPARVQTINRWLSSITMFPDFSAISAYDPIIRREASRCGWDWRLIAAVIYRESKFDEEAESAAGAVGLMQVRPVSISADSLRDPSTNIRIGTEYLETLRKVFVPYAANETECIKLALAGYNAGDGRILQCIRLAQKQGIDASYWDNITPLFEEMKGFSGKETVAFVSGVLETWRKYCRFYKD